MKWNVGFLSAAALSFFLLSCGKEICVGPIGNCQVSGKTLQTGSTTPIASALTMTAPDEVSAGVQFSVSVTGGTPNYRFEITSSSGGTIASQLAAEGKATIAAPLVGAVDMNIRVTDSKGAYKNRAVHVR